MPLKFWAAINKIRRALLRGGARQVVKPKSVCGISVVKRKITANLAVIFLKLVDPRRIELPNLSDANRTLSQLSYGPILAVFQPKKL